MNRQFFTFFSIIFLIFLLLFPDETGEGWIVKKKEDRFQVYQRKKENSEIDEVKTVALISGTISEALQVITDVDNLTDIFSPHLEKTTVIQKGVDCNSVYILMNPPILSRRDAAIKLCTSEISENSFKLYWMDLSGKNDGKNGKTVRMYWNSGGCSFSKTNNQDELKVDCNALLDLGGSIPYFLLNEINSKAITQFIWKIYDEIEKRRKLFGKIKE